MAAANAGGGEVTRLLPRPSLELPLAGLYLAHALRDRGTPGRPFVYTNFIASLDGRISEIDPATRRRRVPEAIANERDWRLYLELLAQADVVVTSARHLRAVAAGRQGAILGLEGPAAEGLAAWRAARGLPAGPAVAALSAELRVPVAAVAHAHPGPLLLLTHRGVPDARAAALEDEGAEVLRVGAAAQLTAAEILAGLAGRGYRCIYSIAGPRVLQTLLDGGLLDRLYLTLTQVALGGTGDGLLPAAPLAAPAAFTLVSAYHDAHAPRGVGQLFLAYDRAGGRTAVRRFR